MRGLSLISSGIDSPVATHLMKSKMEVDAVTFHQGRFSDDVSREKVMKLARKLGLKKIYVVNIEGIQAEIIDKCKRKFTCVLCKRSMYRLAEKIARRDGYDCLISGENLGQVASQTLDNLAVNDASVKLNVLRPLLGFDKQEIVDRAKALGTYEISIIKTVGCKAVPPNPATKAAIDMVGSEEKKLSGSLFDSAIDGLELIEL